MVRRVAIESLGQFEDSLLAREQLLSFLGDDSDVFCKAAAESLVRHGVKALEPLLDILAGASVGKARRWGAYALGRMRDFRAVNPLIEALGSDDSALRAAVVESLGYIGDKGAFDAVLSALHDPDRGVRLRAATALGAIGDERTFEVLLAYLTEPDKGMARFAAVGLGKLGDVRAITPLLDTIREGWLLDSAQALGELSHDNPEAIPYLLAALEDEHMEVRASALDALSVVGAASAFEPALRAFHRAEDETRWRALQAIDRIDPERAMPYLISTLADPHLDTRLTATQILGWHGQNGETRAIEPLISMLDDPDENVQAFAALYLGWIGDSRALPALKHLQAAYTSEIEPSGLGERERDIVACAITLIEMRQLLHGDAVNPRERG
jgi:HEAT repeat protein